MRKLIWVCDKCGEEQPSINSEECPWTDWVMINITKEDGRQIYRDLCPKCSEGLRLL